MSFKNPCVSASLGASVPIFMHSQLATGSVGVGMYPSLMVSFICLALVLMIGSTFGDASSSLRSVSFRTTHMEYPWILPTLSPSSEPIGTYMLFVPEIVSKARETCQHNLKRKTQIRLGFRVLFMCLWL